MKILKDHFLCASLDINPDGSVSINLIDRVAGGIGWILGSLIFPPLFYYYNHEMLGDGMFKTITVVLVLMGITYGIDCLLLKRKIQIDQKKIKLIEKGIFGRIPIQFSHETVFYRVRKIYSGSLIYSLEIETNRYLISLYENASKEILLEQMETLKQAMPYVKFKNDTKSD